MNYDIPPADIARILLRIWDDPDARITPAELVRIETWKECEHLREALKNIWPLIHSDSYYIRLQAGTALLAILRRKAMLLDLYVHTGKRTSHHSAPLAIKYHYSHTLLSDVQSFDVSRDMPLKTICAGLTKGRRDKESTPSGEAKNV